MSHDRKRSLLVFYLYIVVLDNIYWPRGFCTNLKKKKKNETQRTDHICLINLQLPVQSMQVLNPAHGEALLNTTLCDSMLFFPQAIFFCLHKTKIRIFFDIRNQ